MSNMKISRRSFARYVSHSMIAASLMRYFNETQAFGATGRKKIVLCMNANGHMDFNSTKAQLSSGINANILNKHALFVKGMKNSTIGGGDWHGGESAFLSFQQGSKNTQASFFSTMGLDEIHMNAIGVGGIYARDASGGALNVQTDPKKVVQQVFGGMREPATPTDMAAIDAGKKSIIDPCLDDVKAVQKKLGKDGVIFADYLDALVELDKKTRAASAPSPGPGSTPPMSDMCSKEPAIGGGGDPHANYAALLEVIYYMVACDMKQVITLGFADNDKDPYHATIHSASFSDGGKSFAEWTHKCMALTGGLVNKLGSGVDHLQDTAVVYLSEGGAHMINGKFEHAHPTADIPCAVFGKLGGTFSKTGMADAGGAGTANLYRKIADALGGKDIAKIGGDKVTPITSV